MKNLVKAAGLAGILALGSAAAVSSLQAAQPGTSIREGQGVVTELGANASAITYWSNEADGWHVVTTVDTVIDKGGTAEKHAVVRFAALLQPGQNQTVSVPASVNEASPTLQIRRLDDRIEVTRVTAQSE